MDGETIEVGLSGEKVLSQTEGSEIGQYQVERVEVRPIGTPFTVEETRVGRGKQVEKQITEPLIEHGNLHFERYGEERLIASKDSSQDRTPALMSATDETQTKQMIVSGESQPRQSKEDSQSNTEGKLDVVGSYEVSNKDQSIKDYTMIEYTGGVSVNPSNEKFSIHSKPASNTL